MKSRVITRNGNPIFEIDGQEQAPLAYVTYFEENNDYGSFAELGVRLYSLSISLGDQPINTNTLSKPQTYGVFAEKGKADFSGVEASLRQIVEACPDAYIFPRVYICMPQWWIDEHPSETTPVANGRRREALYSDAFRTDGAAMLTALIEYIRQSEFAKHVIGYHVAGGQTEEWFHLDMNGSYCENALPYFNRYLTAQGKPTVERLPELTGWETQERLRDPMLVEYLRFANDCVADTVAYMCRAAKAAVDGEQVVGVFYGYCWGIPHALWGSHSLYKLLDCPDIDFFCSPLAYWENRPLGRDWPEQFPTASVALRGKLCFMECDIRTHLTVWPGQARKGFDPKGLYNSPLFLGPDTEEGAVAAVRKSLAGRLTKKQGLWWFDMFGHWYDCAALKEEIALSKRLYDKMGQAAYEYGAQVALFVDETVFSRIGMPHPHRRFSANMHEALGKVGAPIDYYLLSDAKRVDWSQYRAALFMAPEADEALAQGMALAQGKGVAALAVRETKSAQTLRDFLRESGVHLLCESDDVVYIGNGYLGLHAATAGEKTVCLPEPLICEDLTDGRRWQTDRLTVTCRQYETKLFSIRK